MDINTLANAIHLDPNTIAAVEGLSLPAKEESQLLELYFQDFPLFLKTVEVQADPQLLMLRLYLQLALNTRMLYLQRGLPEAVWLDSMQDIAVWAADYRAKYGKYGIAAWEWLTCSLNMEIFRLGRLQFEPYKLPADVQMGELSFPAGTEVLSVHIPAGTPLTATAVLDSLKQAPTFFTSYFGKDYTLYYCHSWLLSPALSQLLPPDSSIMQFQQLFHIYSTDASPQSEQRVFGCVCENPADYPQNTSLQQRMRQYLMDGNTVPSGRGIGLFEKL